MAPGRDGHDPSSAGSFTADEMAATARATRSRPVRTFTDPNKAFALLLMPEARPERAREGRSARRDAPRNGAARTLELIEPLDDANSCAR